MGMGSKAFESPLISHARMRALYRGLVEMEGLLGSKSEARGLEAAWVATAIDLHQGDLTSDSGGGGEAALLDYLRRLGARPAGGPVRAGDVKRVGKQLAAACPEEFPGSEVDRLICASGAAMALKAAGRSEIMLAYTGQAAIAGKHWQHLLAVLSQPGLPLVLVATAKAAAECDLEHLARKAAPRAERQVPVMRVDGGDVVALYRVAQETIGRARTGGGAAVIQAVLLGTDPIELLGTQLVKKRICTPRWVDAVAPHFRQQLAK